VKNSSGRDIQKFHPFFRSYGRDGCVSGNPESFGRAHAIVIHRESGAFVGDSAIGF